MKLPTLLHFSKMASRAEDTIWKTQERYNRYFDRSVRTTVSIRPGQMVYVDRAPYSILTETKRTADVVCWKLRPKTTDLYPVTAATADTVTIEEGGFHNTISIDRATVSPSNISPQNVYVKDTYRKMPSFRSKWRVKTPSYWNQDRIRVQSLTRQMTV